jgi:hypothetical protein
MLHPMQYYVHILPAPPQEQEEHTRPDDLDGERDAERLPGRAGLPRGRGLLRGLDGRAGQVRRGEGGGGVLEKTQRERERERHNAQCY